MAWFPPVGIAFDVIVTSTLRVSRRVWAAISFQLGDPPLFQIFKSDVFDFDFDPEFCLPFPFPQGVRGDLIAVKLHI